MNKELICIECPNGCPLTATRDLAGLWQISGARCKKGEHFALTELTAPMRTIASLVKTSWKHAPVLPVRVSGPIPKESIFPVMAEIQKLCLTEPVGRGDVIVKNILGLGIDLISESNILKEDVSP